MKLSCIFCSKSPENCPIHSSKLYSATLNLKEIQEFNGVSPPTVFVGSKLKYPLVNIGVMSPSTKVNDPWVMDSPRYWAQNNYGIDDIINLRKQLINSKTTTSVREINNKYVIKMQELGMAINPVDIEVHLKKGVKINLSLDKVVTAMGPSGEISNFEVLNNIKVHNQVEKVYLDTDLKALNAVHFLHKKGFDEQNISQLLSIGVLGLKKNRKLVPTRLSITATDDIIGRKLINDIENFEVINKFCLYFGGYLGNYYIIMFLPANFSYEIFETYLPNNLSNFTSESITDYESSFGRTQYAMHTAGGYYTARLASLEKLNLIKKKASVLVLRFITSEYTIPLGVFVTREASRKTLSNNPIEFEDLTSMLSHTSNLIFNRFKYKIDKIFNKSKLLKDLREQKRLSYFFS